MNRREFLKGLLGTTSLAAFPVMSVLPIGCQVHVSYSKEAVHFEKDLSWIVDDIMTKAGYASEDLDLSSLKEPVHGYYVRYRTLRECLSDLPVQVTVLDN